MTSTAKSAGHPIKQPKGLSGRIQWLRDYYFKGAQRNWTNENTSWTTGTPWDEQYDEITYYIVPETYALMQTIQASYRMTARKVELHEDFWTWSISERRAWFNREVMVNCLPCEILPGDLIAGARFNIQTSMCLNESEARKRSRMIAGKKGARAQMKWFHDHGYGNAGATCGHLVPGHENALNLGWKGIYRDLESRFNELAPDAKKDFPGCQLNAMMTAASMPKQLSAKYASTCRSLAQKESSAARCQELRLMAKNLDRVPWNPPKTFWEAVQALWLNHMLIMADENYPGPGVSFGRMDQYLYPYWKHSLDMGMEREFGKEILKCFWIHANTAYDAMIRTGNQGISSGFGQLITLSGRGKNGEDLTNDLTYAILEVIDEMSPILEPKPNVRLHRNTPDGLFDKLVSMIGESQGAPFILNFDERSMAGMMREARMAGLEHLINEDTVWDYAPVGCLENTMQGNDRSGTVDNNINLLKAVELALTGGKDMLAFTDPVTGKTEKIRQDGPRTADPHKFTHWEQFWEAYAVQTRHIIRRITDLYETSEEIRAMFNPTPYLSCLVKGCAESAKDITQGAAQISFTTIEAVTYATTVDSLLAVKYLVFDEKICTMDELVKALKDNWVGHEILRARAQNKAPKYGRDSDAADDMGRKVMELWTDETWKHRTRSTNRQFRPGMLSWNYWVGDGFIMAASADGRKKGQFLSNAICPSNGADINGPTANTNSVGKVLGGRTKDNFGDWDGYNNMVANGASHTITFNPSIIKDGKHKDKFKAFLRGYCENGGTALQINMVDPEMLRDARENPDSYRHLLVRVTGYNAYFTAIGRELQDEVISRVSHGKF
ncbi:MAG: pyruvate formate lyase family protein [Desulfosalsimonas sp.]